MSIFNEEQIRQAIENFQRTHPVAFAYDISHIDSEESLEEMKNIIDNYIKKAEKDSEMHIIMEMAKQYLNGAKPVIEQKRGRWELRRFDLDTGISNAYFCNVCGKPKGQIYNDFCACCGAKME